MAINNIPGTIEQIQKEIGEHEKNCGCNSFNAHQYQQIREAGFQPNEICFEGCKVFNTKPD